MLDHEEKMKILKMLVKEMDQKDVMGPMAEVEDKLEILEPEEDESEEVLGTMEEPSEGGESLSDEEIKELLRGKKSPSKKEGVLAVSMGISPFKNPSASPMMKKGRGRPKKG